MKKILLFVLLFILAINSTKALKIVSLGDSIPNGYLLDDSNQSYDNLLANTLNADFYEYSYIGMRSDELLSELDNEELKKNISEADIILINIGANDLLDLLDYADLSKVGLEIEYGSNQQIGLNREFLDALKNYLQDFFINTLKPMSIEVANTFSITFPLIIEKIKSYNPTAKIYVNSLYNPFFSISIPILNMDLSEIENVSDEAIGMFNKIIRDNEGYQVIDLYTTLRNNNYLNIAPMNVSFDPHPNKKGHKKIYELYLKELCYKVTYEDTVYYVLKGETLNIEPKEKDGYKFVKWNYDLNNINSDIVLEAIYKKKFNYLYLIPIGLIILVIIGLIIKKKH